MTFFKEWNFISGTKNFLKRIEVFTVIDFEISLKQSYLVFHSHSSEEKKTQSYNLFIKTYVFHKTCNPDIVSKLEEIQFSDNKIVKYKKHNLNIVAFYISI